MKKKISTVLSFIIVFALLVAGYYARSSKFNQFKELQAEVSGFASGTQERLAKAVVTLPDVDMVIGLSNYIGTYKFGASKVDGVVNIEKEYTEAKLLEGSYGGQPPRLDVVVPMSTSIDQNGDSMYILLFNDRGDAMIEKSYARLGAKNTRIEDITILPGDSSMATEEYRVRVSYKKDKDRELKEIVIPVIDGHFSVDKVTGE